jgi:hypothetical protein
MFGAVLLQLPRQCHARAPRVWYHTPYANCQNFMTLRDDGNFLHEEVMLTLGTIQKKRNIFCSLKVWTVMLTTDFHAGLILFLCYYSQYVVLANTIFTEHVGSSCNTSGLYLKHTGFELKHQFLWAHVKSVLEIIP